MSSSGFSHFMDDSDLSDWASTPTTYHPVFSFQLKVSTSTTAAIDAAKRRNNLMDVLVQYICSAKDDAPEDVTVARLALEQLGQNKALEKEKKLADAGLHAVESMPMEKLNLEAAVAHDVDDNAKDNEGMPDLFETVPAYVPCARKDLLSFFRCIAVFDIYVLPLFALSPKNLQIQTKLKWERFCNVRGIKPENFSGVTIDDLPVMDQLFGCGFSVSEWKPTDAFYEKELNVWREKPFCLQTFKLYHTYCKVKFPQIKLNAYKVNGVYYYSLIRKKFCPRRYICMFCGKDTFAKRDAFNLHELKCPRNIYVQEVEAE